MLPLESRAIFLDGQRGTVCCIVYRLLFLLEAAGLASRKGGLMKTGFNMLSWTPFVTEEYFPLFEKLKKMGYDGVEIPFSAAPSIMSSHIRHDPFSNSSIVAVTG